jgi:hypothetical protein
VIDDDLGRSAAGGVQRAGFERMVAQVCLGKVGAVAAREVSRWRLKHSGLRRKLVGSRHSILCRTVPGSSAVPFSPQRRRVPSPNAHARTQGTPRDRIPISKACSLQ